MTDKYVDDSLHLNVVNMRTERTMKDEEGGYYKETQVPQAQAMLNHITECAESLDMRVNDAKTGLMCISSARSFEAKAVLEGRGEVKIKSGDTLKVFGVMIDSDCSFKLDVKNISSAARKKTWALSIL